MLVECRIVISGLTGHQLFQDHIDQYHYGSMVRFFSELGTVYFNQSETKMDVTYRFVNILKMLHFHSTLL